MNIIDLQNKTALVTGVADNLGFAWHIAKALNNAGADIILSSHPRVISIVERFLTKDKYKESRLLKNGQELKVKNLIPCDVALDEGENSVHELAKKLRDDNTVIDALIHSLAFAPEIDKNHLNVSRTGYLTAMSISSYSLISLCKNLLPQMSKNGASVVALSYLASVRIVPFYGGGMASCKAALECDARMLAWFLGEHNHRVNVISAGPYASRAAKAIGDIEKMIEETAQKSPLKKAISADDVANAALFLVSDLSSMISAEVLHVDAGFHAMAIS